MNRIQKKCFIAAAGTHLLLLLVLLFGPAFLTSNPKPDNLEILDYVPAQLIDQALYGGGQPQPPQPQPPTPTPQPQRTPEPAPPKPEPETRPQPAPKPTIKLTPTVRKPSSTTRPTPTPPRNNTAQQALNQSLKRIQQNLSPTTTIEMPGPGGGGPSYAPYAARVKQVYTQAWLIPDDVTDDEAAVTVSVIIARSGNVVSSRIIRRSGSAAVDRSIQATLDRVRFVAPFPEGATDSQREFTITFSLKAKRLLG